MKFLREVLEDLRILREGTHLEVYLPKVLTKENAKDLWEKLEIEKSHPQTSLRFLAEALETVDSSGISCIAHFQRLQKEEGQGFELIGLKEEFQFLFQLATEKRSFESLRRLRLGTNERVGKYTIEKAQAVFDQIVYLGELTVSLFKSLRKPKLIRWKDSFQVAEAMGVNAFPIISLIGFLLGLIMSFQSTIPMRRFGAEIFVANLVGLSLFRELGPLMTAFILSGRSGSAFAAEIGTMKVSEEIDALTTMGLPPVQFLIVPRLLASLIVTPLLTVVFNLFGLLGGALVLYSFGFPFVTFINQVNIAVGANDILGGMLKSLFFGMVIAGMGCYRGLQTTIGAGAVGESTTKAVVSSIIIVSVLDGIFSVSFYYLGV